MMSFEEAEILRERAVHFLENAKELIEKGVYDLAAFNLEQYCRLMLKYMLLVETGTYPRTHSITRLLEILSSVKPGLRVLLEDENSYLMITKLEDAYIGARYLPRRYAEKEVRAMYRFVVEVFKRVIESV